MSAAPPPVPPPAGGSKPKQFPCSNCGANLVWDPTSASQKCPYCGTENAVEQAPEAVATAVVEQDFLATLNNLASSAETIEAFTVRCDGCGAEHALQPGKTADSCPFCGAAVVAQGMSRRLIKPQAVLPFAVSNAQACDAFSRWIGSLWFAPGDLQRVACRDGLKGVYLPAWTYDTVAVTDYTGQRGDDYWETETYTETVNGRTETRTRQVRRTRWRYAAGRVRNDFDDVLVLAVRNLPPKAAKLEPWDLHALVPYDDRYLAGFSADAYTVDLPNGFEAAKAIMEPTIHGAIRRDIGGDHQQIATADSTYYDITFKHLLLPVWASAYRYNNRVFSFMINARTGEVQGDRPYSAWKIALLVIAILVVVLTVVLLVANKR
ncbi:MAG TPA: hypothetical protein VF796_01760 [Humisphaera sp.]